MKPNTTGFQEFKRRFRGRSGPGMLPMALAIWAILISLAFLLAGC